LNSLNHILRNGYQNQLSKRVTEIEEIVKEHYSLQTALLGNSMQGIQNKTVIFKELKKQFDEVKYSDRTHYELT